MNELELFQTQARCISHEIRNHLSICELYTKIIEKNIIKTGINNPSLENALYCIQKSLKIIGNSLIDLKSLNNFSSGKYDLKELLETGLEMSKIYTGDKKIEFDCVLCNDCIVEVDENKFLACIVNIIKNAIEAIEKEGKIIVKCTNQKGIAHIIIANTGNPISAEKRKQIFDEGFTTKSSGSGLGLHICKANLAAQNAELRLNKSDEHSTEFEIVIKIFKNG